MKSFFNKSNINDIQIDLKYNKENINQFLKSNNKKINLDEIFHIILKYKNDFLINKSIIKNTLTQLINDDIDILYVRIINKNEMRISYKIINYYYRHYIHHLHIFHNNKHYEIVLREKDQSIITKEMLKEMLYQNV